MTAFIIDKKDIKEHLELKEELQLICKSVEERDGTFIYKTAPGKSSTFISILKTNHIEFLVRNF